MHFALPESGGVSCVEALGESFFYINVLQVLFIYKYIDIYICISIYSHNVFPPEKQ